jgi:hypothetical protein
MRNLLASVSLLVIAACGGGDDGPDPTFVAWGSSTSTITLAWEPVAGATGYQLARAGGETVSLDAAAVTFLDGELAEGTYSYTLTAIGVDAPSQAAEATTSADRAVVTVDDAPIGDPVVATIGNAGGAIELPDGSARAIIPAGALPDGATVTLQQITPPTDATFAPDLAVEVSSDPAFTQPIEISFVLGEDDLADLANVAVADKQPDGTWVSQAARVEGDRAIVTASPEVDELFAAGRGRARAVRFRRIRVQPEDLSVKAGTTHVLFAYAVYSDETCQTELVVWLCQGLDVPRGDNLAPIPRPIIERRPVKNSDGHWTLDGPGRLLPIEPAHTSVTYVAPDTRPERERWTITFTLNSGISGWSRVRFIGNHFVLTFEYDNVGDDIGYFLGGRTVDKFWLTAEARPDGSMVVGPFGGPHNQATMVSNTYPLPPAIAASWTTPRELVTITGATMDHRNGTFTGAFTGTTQGAGTQVTFEGGIMQSFPSGPPAPISLPIVVENIDFSQITDERLFPVVGTRWYLRVSAAPGP